MELKTFQPDDTLMDKIQIWSENSSILARLKALEMSQRKELDAMLFSAPKQGTNKYELNAGWFIQSVHGTDTKLDAAAYRLIEQELPDNIKDVCITWEPKLDVRAYKKIDVDKRGLLDEAVTTKPKAVAVKLVPPKEDK